MTSTLSAYEELRLRNIARNEAYLAEIGLGADSILKPKKTDKERGGGRGKKRALRMRAKLEPSRKSLRIAEIPGPSFEESKLEVEDEEEDEGEGEVGRKARIASKKRKAQAQQIIARPPPSSDSARAIDADLAFFADPLRLAGPNEDLGFGKAAIMAASNKGAVPKFSKYSGVAEWKNCIFLWVNIGGSGYANTFSEQGRLMTWFGGSRMHAESDVTKRLLKAGGEGECAVLFVRLEGEPYACLGRCRPKNSDVSKQPITILWELLDFDKIKASSNFKRILSS